MIDQIFVINLERRPERLAHFRAECERVRIPKHLIRVWQAVDGQTHMFTADELQMFSPSDLDAASDTGRGCMANQLSHLQILRHIRDTPSLKQCLIFQDDVRFADDFWPCIQSVSTEMSAQKLPFVWVGFHKIGAGSYFEDFDLGDVWNRSHILETRSLEIGTLRPDVNPASLAYLVSREGAMAYLRHVETFGIQHATDINFRDFLLAYNMFCGSCRVLCTGNSLFKSDIFKYDDHALSRDLLELLQDM